MKILGFDMDHFNILYIPLWTSLFAASYLYWKGHYENQTKPKHPPTNSVLVFGEDDKSKCRIHSPKLRLFKSVCCNDKHCSFRNIFIMADYLDRAENTIDAALYCLSNDMLSDAIVRALRRGVKVRLITDAFMALSEVSHIQTLKRAGAEVRMKNTIFEMHLKFVIIDYTESSGVVMTGSFNWSHTWNITSDTVVILTNRSILRDHHIGFERAWASTLRPMDQEVLFINKKG